MATASTTAVQQPRGLRRRLRRLTSALLAPALAAALLVIGDAGTSTNRADAVVPGGTKTKISGQPNGIAVLSVGVTNTTAGGYFQVLPCDATPGAFSTLNASNAGQTIANLAIAQFDAQGEACVFNESGSDMFVDLQGYLAASAFEASTVRLLDTRRPGPGKPPVAPTGRTMFTGRPNGLAVVSIVATESLGPGYLQALPCNAAPGAYSNLNVDRAGQTIANLAIVQLDGNGESCIYTHGGAHTIVDLQGYLNPATFTAASQRLADTRQPGPNQPPIAADGRTVVVGQPNGLAVLSIIATQTQAPGFLQLLGCGENAGAYSNLNSDRAGQTIANLAVIGLDATGTTCLYTQGGGHLVADLQGYFDASVFTAVNSRILDTRQNTAGPLTLLEPGTGPTPTGCATSTIAADQRVSVDPRVRDLLEGVDWATVDELTVRRLAATVMANSGPLPASIAATAAFDGWVQRFLPTPGTPYSAPRFWSALNFAYHETVHSFQNGMCATTATDRGYPTPRLGAPQSTMLADVRTRVRAIIPDSSDFCHTSALSAANTYLTGTIATQGLESQLWELNAYALEMEFQTALIATTGTAVWGGDFMNVYIVSAKLHQFARYLELTKATPGLWDQMRAQGVDRTVADHWNLAVSVWRPVVNGTSQTACWDLAFGPDAAVIAEFTGGLAGTTTPPRP